MKLKEGFVMRELLGQHIITGDGLSRVDFSKIISMNDTAAWLWEQLQGKEFAEDDIVRLLTGRYDVTEEQARTDVGTLTETWRNAGLLAE